MFLELSSSKPVSASSWLWPLMLPGASCHRQQGKAWRISNCGLPAGRSVSFPALLFCIGRVMHWRLSTFIFPCSSLTVHATSEAVIRGVIGQSVKLPCFYKVTRHKDISDMCWGRGPCPNSKCNNKVLHTTRNRVTYRISQRYSLRGYISYGDVSLTIANVQSEDAGTYCCRVEIPGWFNDIKQTIQLEVDRGESGDLCGTASREEPLTGEEFKTGSCVMGAFFVCLWWQKSVFPKFYGFQGRSAASCQFQSH